MIVQLDGRRGGGGERGLALALALSDEHVGHQLLVIGIGKVIASVLDDLLEHDDGRVSGGDPCTAVEISIGGWCRRIRVKAWSTMIDHHMRPTAALTSEDNIDLASAPVLARVIKGEILLENVRGRVGEHHIEGISEHKNVLSREL
jgi:hypothetical protein